MRILFSIRPYYGHLHPLVPLALHLEGRGHEVAIATSEEMASAIAGIGIAWWPAGIHPASALEAFPDDDADYGLGVVSSKLADLLEIMLGDFRPDVIIRDPTDLAPAVAADTLQIPSGVFGFSHFIARSSWPILGADVTLAELRRQYELPPDPDFDSLYNGLYLGVFPPSLEVMEPIPVQWLQRLRYHVFDGGAAMAPPSWINELGDRPTVLVTLGTVYNTRPELFEALVGNLAGEDLNIVCTLGDAVPGELASLAGNVWCEEFLPHSLILPKCAAVVCHAGFNTMMGAVCAGVPLVLVPLGSDQDYNAWRCDELRLGVRLSEADVWSGAVAGALRQVLDDPSYAENVAVLRGEIEALPDLDASVRAIEELAGGLSPTRSPKLASHTGHGVEPLSGPSTGFVEEDAHSPTETPAAAKEPSPRIETKKLPWSLQWIVDEERRDTGFAAVQAGVGPTARDAFNNLAADHRMIGITHYGEFPLYHEAWDGRRLGRDPTKGWERPEVLACEAWCHGFRNPDEFLPPGIPRIMMSGSDFVDHERVWRIGHGDRPAAKRWDVIYTCLPNWFNEMTKNWDLAKPCLVRLAEAGARVLMVGRAGVPDTPRHPNIEQRPRLRWDELLRATAQSRVCFVPNQLDASPRVLTEALSLDVPVLVNRQIVAGWKYVVPETGRFFDNEDDAVDVALESLVSSFRPREWLVDNGYGRDAAARRLAAHLQELGGPVVGKLDYALPSHAPPRDT